MKLKEDSTEQKLRGGYYTPKALADFIVKWALPKKSKENNYVKILEPSCGDGVFLESVIDQSDGIPIKCTAIELLEREAQIAKERTFYHPDINIIVGDFYEQYERSLKKQKI
ncbi:N-6 DNA methylase [Aeribacillus sp. SP014]